MASTACPQDTAMSSPGRLETKQRRKVRRGTHSCWECKRRKVRCSYATPLDPCCIGCRRRGTTCLSQQDVDDSAAGPWATLNQDRRIGDRMVRVEALVERLASHVNCGVQVGSHPKLLAAGARADPDSEPAVSGSPQEALSVDYLSPPQINTSFRNVAYEPVSAALHAALPSLEDINLIIKADLDVSVHRLMTSSLAALSQRPDGFKAGLADVPAADGHPVLLAKYMLIMATCLQSAHPGLHADALGRLSEPPLHIMRRAVEAATNLVTSKDEFLASVEGIECIMLESMYLANSGNLRRAWLVCRRAMVVAQMLGLHRSDCQHPPILSTSSQSVDPSFLWFRIVCTDRQLCLMLGLPQGTLDVSMATQEALANDSPSGRFERKHCVIASRILARNESSDSFTEEEFAATLKLDVELQSAANEMPSKWWLLPNLASALHDQEKTLWEMLRLIEQMLYFNLLNLLHLPYMLRSGKPGTGQVVDQKDYEYSKLTSINASRELLTRYIMLRSHNRVASACRSVDFFAITAAMTLVISHLSGHSKQRQMQPEVRSTGMNLLAHQRNGDRAMMEKVVENMEAVARLSTDFMSQRGAGLLKGLLALEDEAAKRKPEDSRAEDGHFFRLGIPYFGTIRISRDGDIVSMDTSQSYTDDPMQFYGGDYNPTPVETPPVQMTMLPSATQVAQQSLQSSSSLTHVSETVAQQPGVAQYPTAIDDVLTQQYPYPGLTANVDEYMFQSTDTVFFDNLMRGSGLESISDSASAWAS